MFKIVLASHGTLSKGIESALQILYGNIENITCISGYLDEKFDLNDEIEEIFKSKSQEDTIIVLTDILGGSINNEFMRRLKSEEFYLISGLNLGLVLEILLLQNNENLEKNLIDIINKTKESITLCNNLIHNRSIDESF